MKRFIRSIAGKTIIFIACILSLCTLAGCALGGILIADSFGYNFYTHSEQEIYEEITYDRLRSRGYCFLRDAVDVNQDMPVTDSNYIFEVLDENGESLYHSADVEDISQWQYSYSFYVFKNDENEIEDINWYGSDSPANKNDVYYKVNMSLKEGSPDANEYGLIAKLLHIAYSLRYAVYVIGAVALLVTIICFIVLMCVSGRKPHTDEICSGPLHFVPFDLLLSVCFVFAISTIWLCDAIADEHEYVGLLLVAAGSFIVDSCVLLGVCMSVAARIKLHSLITNTIIFRCLKLARKIICRFFDLLKKLHSFNMSIIHSFPLIWKSAIALFGLSFLEFLVILVTYRDTDILLVFFFFEKLIIIPAVLYLAVCLRKLQKGGIALAGGNLSFVTDTKGMFWDLKQHGENLNSIADGMSIAVEDRMKSERMKTELITNVSHDIKTPLTSIINYATLIGNEPSENAKITEYSEVLVRQSERLKRLIEDLVEASKASSGNLDVNLAPCDATVFLTQAAGEYEEKLQRSELTLIVKQPDKELRIMADGRRMWRIFDNLMNNICKYAQSGTRVYLSLEQIGNSAVITFKNTSREPLDMTEEELMERFTRGDSSRNTEGNGLGLSIAKSIAELQNGTLKLSIDGDLFKAILTFPMI